MCSIERDDSSPYTRTQMRSLTFHMLYALDTYNYENSVAYVIDNINRGYEQDIPMDGEIASRLFR